MIETENMYLFNKSSVTNHHFFGNEETHGTYIITVSMSFYGMERITSQ